MITLRQKILLRLRGPGGGNARNGLWSAVEYLVQAGSLVVITPLILNLRGSEEFGIFILAQTISGSNGMFSLGLTQATLKVVSEMRGSRPLHEIPRIVNATLWITLGLGLLVVSGVFFGAAWMAESLFSFQEPLLETATKSLQLAGLGLFAYLMTEVIASVCHGFERYDLTAPVHSLRNLLILLVQVVVLLRGGDVKILLLVQVLFFLLATTLMFVIVRLKLLPNYSLFAHPKLADIRRLFSFGFYSWLSGLFSALRTRGDILLVGAILGGAAVSYYSVAQRLLAQAHTMLVRSFNFLFPYVSRLHACGNLHELEAIYNKYTFLIGSIGMLIIAPLSAMGTPILRVWLNPDVANEAGPLMHIMAVRFAVFPLSIVNSYFLLGTGRIRLMTVIIAVNALVALLFIAWGSSIWGLKGAAMGQLSILPGLIITRLVVEKSLFGRARTGRVVMPVALAALVILGTNQFVATVQLTSPMLELGLHLGGSTLFAIVGGGGLYWILMKKEDFLKEERPHGA